MLRSNATVPRCASHIQHDFLGKSRPFLDEFEPRLVPVASLYIGKFDDSCRMAHSQRMEKLANITIDPARRSGKPCIRNTRITVYDVLEYLASGMSEAEIVADFPELAIADIRACLTFAAERERRLAGAA